MKIAKCVCPISKQLHGPIYFTYIGQNRDLDLEENHRKEYNILENV